MIAQALAFAEAGFPILPVRVYEQDGRWKKLPLREWDLATTDEAIIARWWQQYPDALPAIPLRKTNLCVVDADRRDGLDGVAQVTDLGPLGPHSRIKTPSGGLHLVFAQPDPPITSKFDWCAGVEVLGSASLLTCYDLEELKFPHVAPRAVLPKMFWQPRADVGDEARRTPLISPRSAAHRAPHDAVYVADVTAALRKMDACDWRGDYFGWFALMTACCFEGISARDFVAWSTRDPVYATDGALIRKMWRKLNPQHGGALFAALAERGIKIRPEGKGRRTEVGVINGVREGPPSPIRATRTINLIARCERTCSVLKKAVGAQRRQELWNSACVMAEMIGENRLVLKVAKQLLRNALQENRLWQENRELCETIIGRAYRHVELKVLGETETATSKGD
jgi:hypothetical protein